jgi:hypothetical protein
MDRQQQLIAAITKKLASGGFNPIEMRKVIRIISKSIYTDDKISENDILDRISNLLPLNEQLGGLDSMITPVKTWSYKTNNGEDAVLLDNDNIKKISYLLRKDIPFLHSNYKEIYEKDVNPPVSNDTTTSPQQVPRTRGARSASISN